MLLPHVEDRYKWDMHGISHGDMGYAYAWETNTHAWLKRPWPWHQISVLFLSFSLEILIATTGESGTSLILLTLLLPPNTTHTHTHTSELTYFWVSTLQLRFLSPLPSSCQFPTALNLRKLKASFLTWASKDLSQQNLWISRLCLPGLVNRTGDHSTGIEP